MQPIVRTRGATKILTGLLALCLLPSVVAAQADSVVVTAGSDYDAGSLHAALLGQGYRDLWSMPIRVEMLDPETFAGGLRPLQEGGGFSTISLRVEGKSGREYTFRWVDKDVTRGLDPEYRGTLVEWLIQDQVAAKIPAAPIAIPPLLEAAGVLHVEPTLYVMPDHPFLGEFRESFAGLLGMIEEHPNEDEDRGITFENAVVVAATDRLLEHLERTPDHRVDARAFLTARLVDLLIGDWDRHEDQWRWARFDRDGAHVWLPIPRDRDNAFVRHEGRAIGLLRGRLPQLAEFRSEYSNIYGLTFHAAPLDRRILSELHLAAWDSTASQLRLRITDEVIDAAIARFPPEYRAARGAELTEILRARRDGLPAVAREFYLQLAGDVDIRATDERDLAEIDRLADGSIDVRLYRRGEGEGAAGGAASGAHPYFQRRFHPAETREVRIYLHGDDDRAVVRGDARNSIMVRIVGGGGSDVLVDSSTVRSGRRTAFYDDRGDNEFIVGARTLIDRRPYEPPPVDTTVLGPDDSDRDWGGTHGRGPVAFWQSNVGPVAGWGPHWRRQGFRRHPHAYQVGVRGLVAPLARGVGVELVADRPHRRFGDRTSVWARLSNFETTRFHGFGNDSGDGGEGALYLVRHNELRIEPAAHFSLADNLSIVVAGDVRYTDPRAEAGGPAERLQPLGSRGFGQLGGRAALLLGAAESPATTWTGHRVEAGIAAHHGSAGIGPFASADAEVVVRLPIPALPGTMLALRAGGQKLWGDFPFQSAAFIGGSSTVRGYDHQRFAGDGALYGSSEVRLRLLPVTFPVRGHLGAFGHVDAGRVFVGSESPGGVHTGIGGGLWVELLGTVASAGYAQGYVGRTYLSLGFPF